MAVGWVENRISPKILLRVFGDDASQSYPNDDIRVNGRVYLLKMRDGNGNGMVRYDLYIEK